MVSFRSALFGSIVPFLRRCSGPLVLYSRFLCVVRFPCWPLFSLPVFFAYSCLVLFLVGWEGCAMERLPFGSRLPEEGA